MEHDFATLSSVDERAGIADVGPAELDAGRQRSKGVAAMKIVEDQDLTGLIRDQPLDQMCAYKPGSARYQNFHFF